jgi:hypothetical protein
LFAVGAALAALPWLSSRFVVLAVVAGLAVAARVMTDRSRLAARLSAFTVCPIISGIAFFLFFQMIYGTPNPSVVYGETPTMTVSASNLDSGIPGLLVDQQFGLFSNAPVFLCACAGFVVMLLRGPRRLGVELLLIAVGYFLVGAAFTSWWGGTTAAARYVTPIAPMLAVPAAVWFSRAKGPGTRVVGLAALLLSLLITTTIAAVDRGAFVFNFRDGKSHIALWLSPVVDLTTALPSLFQNPPGVVMLQTAVWLAAIATAVAAAMLAGRRGRVEAVLAFGLALEIGAMAAVSAVWRSNDKVVATPYAGGPALLRRFHPDGNQIALAYRPFQRLERGTLPRQIVLSRGLSESRPEPAVVGRVPPGTYEVNGVTVGAPSGRVRIRTDRVSGPLVDWDAAEFGPSWTRQVTLPLAVASLQVEADAVARRAVRDVSVRAVSVAARRDRLEGREARRAARYGPALVFLLNGDAWMEPTGAWIAGGSSAEFAVAAEGPSPLQIFVRNGPVENDVTLESPGWRESLQLKPGEERFVRTTPDNRPDNPRLLPLKLSTSNGFRPADFDPKTEDIRILGVWIETR